MKKSIIVLGVTALCSAPIAAEEIDHLMCRSAVFEEIEQSEELTLLTLNDTGLVVSRIENSALHAMNSRCNGIVRSQPNTKDQFTPAIGYCKYLDKDGDAVYLEWSRLLDGQQPWHFIHGTGKWTDVSGGGKWNTHETGVLSKSQVAGTSQDCVHVTGEYKLP